MLDHMLNGTQSRDHHRALLKEAEQRRLARKVTAGRTSLPGRAAHVVMIALMSVVKR